MTSDELFSRGPFSVGERTFQAKDVERDRMFPCEIWYPADTDGREARPKAGMHPLIIYSHPSQFHRRAATFLTTHLSSHGYVVAALDHSEVVARLGPKEGETPEGKAGRFQEIIRSRVQDVPFLLDHVLHNNILGVDARFDASRIGIVGHSLGGWTALAVPDIEPRIRAVVALAPAGASNPRPGILPATLDFAWGRDVPTLLLVAENDVSLPLAGMHEIFERTPSTKQMVILRRADHVHFMDNMEQLHEGFRTMPAEGDLALLQKEVRPFAELCPADKAHSFVRGLALAHFEATLRNDAAARRFMAGDIVAELAARGVEVY